jgi:hypothetical protein
MPYKHENTLRTMLDALGIAARPGAAASAVEMLDFFAPAKPLVDIGSPADNAAVGSFVAIRASATPTVGSTITGWYVYVDSAAKYSTGATNIIHPTVTMSAGAHAVLVRAWDSSGAFGDKTFSVVVQPKPVVTVFTPVNCADVGSPVNIRASASATAGHTISGWWIYADGLAVYSTGAVKAINANLRLKIGTHTLLIRAWDTSGSYGDQTLAVTIGSKPAVVVYGPAPGSSVVSPIHIHAFAAPPSGEMIRG